MITGQKKRIMIFGSPFFTQLFINYLQDYYEFEYIEVVNKWQFLKKVKECDILLSVGKHYYIKRWFISFILGKKNVRYWIGTDANQYDTDLKHRLKLFFINRLIHVHLATSKNIAYHLYWSLFRERAIPIIWFSIDRKEIEEKFSGEIPQKHNVLLYLPKRNKDVYNEEMMFDVIKRFPETRFTIIANDGVGMPQFKNVQYLGYLKRNDLLELYNKITIYLRYPRHDGLSGMVQESLCFGRDVIYNKKLPFVHYCREKREIIKTMKILLSEKPKINYEQQSYYLDKLNYRRFVKKIKTLI